MTLTWRVVGDDRSIGPDGVHAPTAGVCRRTRSFGVPTSAAMRLPQAISRRQQLLSVTQRRSRVDLERAQTVLWRRAMWQRPRPSSAREVAATDPSGHRWSPPFLVYAHSLCGGARWWPPAWMRAPSAGVPVARAMTGVRKAATETLWGFLFGDSWGMRVFGRVHVRRPRRFVPPWVHGVCRLWNGGRATWTHDGIVVPGIRRASRGSKYCAQT